MVLNLAWSAISDPWSQVNDCCRAWGMVSAAAASYAHSMGAMNTSGPAGALAGHHPHHHAGSMPVPSAGGYVHQSHQSIRALTAELVYPYYIMISKNSFPAPEPVIATSTRCIKAIQVASHLCIPIHMYMALYYTVLSCTVHQAQQNNFI